MVAARPVRFTHSLAVCTRVRRVAFAADRAPSHRPRLSPHLRHHNCDTIIERHLRVHSRFSAGYVSYTSCTELLCSLCSRDGSRRSGASVEGTPPRPRVGRWAGHRHAPAPYGSASARAWSCAAAPTTIVRRRPPRRAAAAPGQGACFGRVEPPQPRAGGFVTCPGSQRESRQARHRGRDHESADSSLSAGTRA